MRNKITVLNICLNDIPADKKRIGKNKKEYVNLVVSERKEKDDQGNTHTVYIELSKEERTSGANKVYVGSAKEIEFKS